MRIVVFASQKGGSGKTTLAGHIAVEAERSGAGPVALIDTDPQGSLSRWWNERTSETPLFANTRVPRLAEDIEAMERRGIKLLIFDTPPANTWTIEHVIEVSDLVVIPTRPSPHDLRAAGTTVELVERLRKSLVFVLNGAAPRARITGEAAIALSQHGTVAPVTIHQRTDFAASMIDGRTVGELDMKSRSAGEITQLWGYLDERLDRALLSYAPRPDYAAGDARVGSTYEPEDPYAIDGPRVHDPVPAIPAVSGGMAASDAGGVGRVALNDAPPARAAIWSGGRV